MKRLFLDANVLFTAAHNTAGKSYLIVSLAVEDAWEVYTSGFAVEEARRNLAAKYPEAEKIFFELIALITVVPESPASPYPADLNEKDRPISQAAFACGATHLITGDIVHFGELMKSGTTEVETRGIAVMTPAMFLASI